MPCRSLFALSILALTPLAPLAARAQPPETAAPVRAEVGTAEARSDGDLAALRRLLDETRAEVATLRGQLGSTSGLAAAVNERLAEISGNVASAQTASRDAVRFDLQMAEDRAVRDADLLRAIAVQMEGFAREQDVIAFFNDLNEATSLTRYPAFQAALTAAKQGEGVNGAFRARLDGLVAQARVPRLQSPVLATLGDVAVLAFPQIRAATTAVQSLRTLLPSLAVRRNNPASIEDLVQAQCALSAVEHVQSSGATLALDLRRLALQGDSLTHATTRALTDLRQRLAVAGTASEESAARVFFERLRTAPDAERRQALLHADALHRSAEAVAVQYLLYTTSYARYWQMTAASLDLVGMGSACAPEAGLQASLTGVARQARAIAQRTERASRLENQRTAFPRVPAHMETLVRPYEWMRQQR